jgi:hypothetical protein
MAARAARAATRLDAVAAVRLGRVDQVDSREPCCKKCVWVWPPHLVSHGSRERLH